SGSILEMCDVNRIRIRQKEQPIFTAQHLKEFQSMIRNLTDDRVPRIADFINRCIRHKLQKSFEELLFGNRSNFKLAVEFLKLFIRTRQSKAVEILDRPFFVKIEEYIAEIENNGIDHLRIINSSSPETSSLDTRVPVSSGARVPLFSIDALRNIRASSHNPALMNDCSVMRPPSIKTDWMSRVASRFSISSGVFSKLISSASTFDGNDEISEKAMVCTVPSKTWAAAGIRPFLSITSRMGFFPSHCLAVSIGLSSSTALVPVRIDCSSVRHLCTS